MNLHKLNRKEVIHIQYLMKIYNILFVTFIILLLPAQMYSNKTDSLKQALLENPGTEEKAQIFIDLGWELYTTNPSEAIDYGKKALLNAKQSNNNKLMSDAYVLLGVISEKNSEVEIAIEYFMQAKALREIEKDYKGVSSVLNNLGVLYYNKGNYPKAIEYYSQALDVAVENEDITYEALFSSNIGEVYEDIGEHSKALTYYVNAQKLFEKINNQSGIANTMLKISNIYELMGYFNKAIEMAEQAQSIYQKINEPSGEANACNKLGILYKSIDQYENAFDYYEKGIQIYESLNKEREVANLTHNLGALYFEIGNIDKALDYYQKAFQFYKETNSKYELAIIYHSIATIYFEKNEYQQALEFITKSLKESRDIDFKMKIKENYLILSDLYAELGNYAKAYDYHKKYSRLSDTLLNEAKNKQLLEMQIKYDTEKKEKEIALLEQQQLVKDTQIKKQRIVTLMVMIGLLLSIILGLVVYRSNKQKQRANELLHKQNVEISQQKEEISTQRDEIQKQRDEIEYKNKNITDSIRYAQRIQQAFLPPKEQMKEIFPESFVLFMPKDIVSGDFYWIDKSDNQVFVSAVDCTGHGVPGAFMSIVGHNLLAEAIREKKINEPAEVLQYLNQGIYNTFSKKQSQDNVKDGMDLVLCALDKKNSVLTFSGALNPLYLFRNGSIIQFKGDTIPIGTSVNKAKNTFTQERIHLLPNDIIYLFSDGYPDQFGGEKRKKFMIRRFRELLIEVASLPMEDQKELLMERFKEWKADNEQTDDVLIMGIKIV